MFVSINATPIKSLSFSCHKYIYNKKINNNKEQYLLYKLNTFCPTAVTRKPTTCVIAVTGPFCSFIYTSFNLNRVNGASGSGTTSIIS